MHKAKISDLTLTATIKVNFVSDTHRWRYRDHVRHYRLKCRRVPFLLSRKIIELQKPFTGQSIPPCASHDKHERPVQLHMSTEYGYRDRPSGRDAISQ